MSVMSVWYQTAGAEIIVVRRSARISRGASVVIMSDCLSLAATHPDACLVF